MSFIRMRQWGFTLCMMSACAPICPWEASAGKRCLHPLPAQRVTRTKFSRFLFLWSSASWLSEKSKPLKCFKLCRLSLSPSPLQVPLNSSLISASYQSSGWFWSLNRACALVFVRKSLLQMLPRLKRKFHLAWGILLTLWFVEIWFTSDDKIQCTK